MRESEQGCLSRRGRSSAPPVKSSQPLDVPAYPTTRLRACCSCRLPAVAYLDIHPFLSSTVDESLRALGGRGTVPQQYPPLIVCVSMFHLHIYTCLYSCLCLCCACLCLCTRLCTHVHMYTFMIRKSTCATTTCSCAAPSTERCGIRPHGRGSGRQGMQSRVLELRSTVPVESLLYSCLFG